MEILDVTQIEPRLKHPTIFQKYDQMAEGESFILYNDHDPKHVYYLLMIEKRETFSWEYVLEGPEFWKVKITKI